MPNIISVPLVQWIEVDDMLQISILMRQTEGDRNYTAPPLRSAPVFGGIAGIMSNDQSNEDSSGIGHMPTLTSKSKEAGELQDMYRRTLAAYWAAQPGELKADECIENIFAGGDGWGDRVGAPGKGLGTARGRLSAEESVGRGSSPLGSGSENGNNSPRSSGTGKRGGAHSPLLGATKKDTLRGSRGGSRSDQGGTLFTKDYSMGASNGTRESVYHQQAKSTGRAEAELQRYRPPHEVDELEARDDLRSWKYPGAAVK